MPDFLETRTDLAAAIAANHAEIMAAHKQCVEAANRQAEECLRLRQAEERRAAEEHQRRMSYEALSARFLRTAEMMELILEVQRLLASALMHKQPPQSPEERHNMEALLKKFDRIHQTRLDKLAELEMARIMATDVGERVKLDHEIARIKGEIEQAGTLPGDVL
jgi:hypothetical protein